MLIISDGNFATHNTRLPAGCEFLQIQHRGQSGAGLDVGDGLVNGLGELVIVLGAPGLGEALANLPQLRQDLFGVGAVAGEVLRACLQPPVRAPAGRLDP